MAEGPGHRRVLAAGSHQGEGAAVHHIRRVAVRNSFLDSQTGRVVAGDAPDSQVAGGKIQGLEARCTPEGLVKVDHIRRKRPTAVGDPRPDEGARYPSRLWCRTRHQLRPTSVSHTAQVISFHPR